MCLSPTGGGGSAGKVKRGSSEKGDNMRRSRSQGTRARLVRAFTTAGGGSNCNSGGLSTTPEDIPCTPPRSPGGPLSAPTAQSFFSNTHCGANSSVTSSSTTTALVAGGGGGCGSSCGGSVARLEIKGHSLLFTRHSTSLGSNVT